MLSKTPRRFAVALLAGAIGAAALAGPAQAQRQDNAPLVIQHAQTLQHQLLTPRALIGPDVVFALDCREVGNGDVATVVRLTNQSPTATVPAGHNVTVYGSQGQGVHTFALPSSLVPGGHVDVTVVPWQAVYQGCSATTYL